MIYYVTPVIDMIDKDMYSHLLPSLTSDQRNFLIPVTNDEGDSVFKKFNVGVERIKTTYGEIQEDDIFVFLHSDVTLCDDLLEEKLKMVFNNDKEVGLVGVYGTTSLSEEGGWWLNDRSLYGRGHIIQGHEHGVERHMADRIGYFDDVVSIDGCFMAMRGSILNDFKFDESYKGYHFYDVDTSLTIQQMGYKVAVADILIKHQSEGPLSKEWEISRNQCINKWHESGVRFPVTSEQMKGIK